MTQSRYAKQYLGTNGTWRNTIQHYQNPNAAVCSPAYRIAVEFISRGHQLSWS